MIKRVRDKIRQPRPQSVVSYAEWKDVEERARLASLFIQEANPLYLILKTDLELGERTILENRVHEVKEVRTITETFQKIFTIEKQEQIDELVGQIKYIRGYLSELESWIERKASLEKMEADGTIIINRQEAELIE